MKRKRKTSSAKEVLPLAVFFLELAKFVVELIKLYTK